TNKQYTSQVNPRLLHVHWEGSYILSKTEKHTVGEPCGAYIKTALQVSACRALKITSQTIFRDIEITVAV
ncbi:MAG: hypothetical protein IKG34_00890, partial [Solobacterium sp.]|nr:hypothetical protein [Solobacterium sp.]